MKLFDKLISKGKCHLAVLVDPDKFNPDLIKLANTTNTSFFMVGGSKIKVGSVAKTVKSIKKLSKLPVILFPGDEHQLCKDADGLFVLSLLSGRNPEYLIEKHVKAARKIQQLKLNTFPLAYILVDGGHISETQRVTNTKPLSGSEMIVNTSIAAMHLGFKAVYLEAGSGAQKSLKSELIKKVKSKIDLPLIIGGGIDSVEKAKNAKKAGANVIVIGNALERTPELLLEISKQFKK